MTSTMSMVVSQHFGRDNLSDRGRLERWLDRHDIDNVYGSIATLWS